MNFVLGNEEDVEVNVHGVVSIGGGSMRAEVQTPTPIACLTPPHTRARAHTHVHTRVSMVCSKMGPQGFTDLWAVAAKGQNGQSGLVCNTSSIGKSDLPQVLSAMWKTEAGSNLRQSLSAQVWSTHSTSTHSLLAPFQFFILACCHVGEQSPSSTRGPTSSS